MKLLEFLQEDNGKYSSARLLSFFIVISFVIEWMHSIFHLTGIYSPDYAIVGLIFGIMGIKALHKKTEQTIDRNIDKNKPEIIETNNSSEA